MHESNLTGISFRWSLTDYNVIPTLKGKLIHRHIISRLNLLVCWWVRLHSLPVDCLAWGDPALYGSLVGLMADSRRAHSKEYFPELLLTVSCPCGEPQLPSASAGDPPTLAGRSGSVSYGVTAPSPWVLMCTLLCVCPPRMDSLFPTVLSKSCNQILLAFKVWFSGNSSTHCWTPRLGSLTWGSEPLLQWVHFCSIIVLQFVKTHPVVMGFDFIVIVPLLPSHWSFSFVFGNGVSFLVSSNVFLSMIVPQFVVILVLL